jgi:hypothetical protein
MKFAQVTGWVEQHPTESIVIGAGGLIAVLWLLGFFSGSSSASSSGSSNLASAYYAAEAQQAVVGGQIQVATIQSAAATAQNAAQVNGAVAVAKSQSKAATTINGQNATAATTINGQDDATAAAASSNQLLATYSNNATAAEVTASNNSTAATINTNNINGSIMTSYINSIAAPELAKGILPDATIGGVGGQGLSLGTSGPVGGTPSWYSAVGYTASQIAAMFG